MKTRLSEAMPSTMAFDAIERTQNRGITHG
jgi:hypothetical protein